MQKEMTWSPTIRATHWIIAILTPVLFFSGEAEATEIHLVVGPVLLLALMVRIWIGFTGKPHERFSSFFYGPAALIEQMKGMFTGHTKRPAGHNPLAGPVMFLMIFVLFIDSIMGEFLRAAGEEEGPLAPFLAGTPKSILDPVEIMHSSFGHLMIPLVLMHFAGLILHTILHKENIAKAMITGEKIVDKD